MFLMMAERVVTPTPPEVDTRPGVAPGAVSRAEAGELLLTGSCSEEVVGTDMVGDGEMDCRETKEGKERTKESQDGIREGGRERRVGKEAR